jgi:citrate synthase
MKIGRPRQLYTGSPRRDYLDITKRWNQTNLMF